MTDAPRPTRPGRRTRTTVVGIIAGVALLYIAVVVLYGISGRVELTGTGNAVDGNGLPLQVSPEGVDPIADRMAVGFELKPSGELDGSGIGLSLARPVTLLVTGNDGPRTTDFAAGGALSPIELHLLADGQVQLWPFDSYTSKSIVAAVATDGGEQALELEWVANVRSVPGWTFELSADERDVPVNGYDLTIVAHRTGATVAFGIVLLALMVVMPVLVLTVAISVYRGRRRMEPTLMGWIAAMLFATIPLRGFLPGSPPIGSWIDYLVVLWVIAGLIAGLVIYVLAFMRWASSASSPDRTPAPESVPGD